MVGAGGDAPGSLILFKLILQKKSMTLPTPLWQRMGNTSWSGARYMKPWEDMACFHSMSLKTLN